MNPTTARAEEVEYFMAGSQAFEEARQERRVAEQATYETLSLGPRLLSEFSRAESDRLQTEIRFLDDLRQYKGIYTDDIEKTCKDRSRAFWRKTRVKVNTATSRMMEMLFPAGADRNFSIEASPEPELPADLVARARRDAEVDARLEVQQQQQAQQSGATVESEPFEDLLERKFRAHIRTLAEWRASAMQTRIDDQLSEVKYKAICKQVIKSGNIFGLGILKGPLVDRKVRISYKHDEKAGKWKQSAEFYVVPFVDFVPVWHWYPDMNATCLEDCTYVWERHKMTKNGMLELADRKSFDGKAIIEYVKALPYGSAMAKNYEPELRALGDRLMTASGDGLYEALERWGWIDGEDLVGAGVKIPCSRRHETFFANIWVLPNGRIIRAVLQPLNGVTWPYHLYYFDKDETSIFGEGIPAVMRDDQEMMNAGIRALLDNAAISAGPMLEVFTSLMASGSDYQSMHPWKIFMRTGGDPQYPAVRPIELDGHINELAEIVKMFDNNADEVTALPRFWYGSNPTQGAAATMGGLSMLMANASVALKDMIVNYDEVTSSFITAMYRWNMQFGSDMSIKGDYSVVALGASSLMAKEVRGTALQQFSASLSPEERRYIKWYELTQQKAQAHDLSGVVMEKDDALSAGNDQLAQMQQELAMKTAELKLSVLEQNVAKIMAQVRDIDAGAMKKRMDALYAGLQGAGIARHDPGIGPVADSLVRDAGWTDQGAPAPNDGGAAQVPLDAGALPGGEVPPLIGPGEGERTGIKTNDLGLNQ